MHEALLTLGRARATSLNRLANQALHEFIQRNGKWERIESWLLETGARYRAATDALLSEPGVTDPFDALT